MHRREGRLKIHFLYYIIPRVNWYSMMIRLLSIHFASQYTYNGVLLIFLKFKIRDFEFFWYKKHQWFVINDTNIQVTTYNGFALSTTFVLVPFIFTQITLFCCSLSIPLVSAQSIFTCTVFVSLREPTSISIYFPFYKYIFNIYYKFIEYLIWFRYLNI